MPSGTYYIDGPTLATATAVYTDAELTTSAPDGFYSDGTISREQISGVLSYAQVCPVCAVDCGSGLSGTTGVGIYSINVDIEPSYGCFIVYVESGDIPDGVRATFGSDVYNELTSPTYGYLASGTSGNFTYIGRSSDDCNIGTTLDAGGYSDQDRYAFNGTTFDLEGSDGTVTGSSGDVQLTVAAPGYCTLYVPILIADPPNVVVEIFGVCPLTSANFEVVCPTLLTEVPTSNEGASSCSSDFPQTFYNVPNRGGTAGEPALHEFFVRDEYGTQRVAAGNYTINPPSGKKDIIVSSNGIITSITACP